MLPDHFKFTLPTNVIYGVGILGHIGEFAKAFGKRRAILVTDKILTQLGPVEKVKTGFKDSLIEIVCTFDKVPPNSTIETVEDCAQLGKKNECDLIIAIGGGSVMDTAKVANILMVKGGRVQDHMGAYLLGTELLHPSILIPTTAGTGSEVSKVAIIADLKNNLKLPFAENQFSASLAVLDPEVTLMMPPKLTAITGLEALTHAIEAYVSKKGSPVSEALALHAIKMIHDNILVATAHPKNLEARGAMLVASCIAGIASSHSLYGMVHAISQALGGIYHIPHGLANALVLPEVMEYNLKSSLERFVDISEALGLSFAHPVTISQSILQSHRHQLPYPQLTNMGMKALARLNGIDRYVQKQQAKAGIERVRVLNRQLAHLTGMPLNLKDAGIDDHLGKIEQVATIAMQDETMLYNPRKPEQEAVIKMVRRLYNDKSMPLVVVENEFRPAHSPLILK
ncbi:iron-containing alcohol dehydrogenase [Deltaproteobacteria bacterium TL4]